MRYLPPPPCGGSNKGWALRGGFTGRETANKKKRLLGLSQLDLQAECCESLVTLENLPDGIVPPLPTTP